MGACNRMLVIKILAEVDGFSLEGLAFHEHTMSSFTGGIYVYK